jgi:hypothetical protein
MYHEAEKKMCILEMDWFNRWKNYTQFEKAIEGLEGEFEYTHFVKQHPGFIQNEVIQDANPVYFTGHPGTSYLNKVLKENVKENEDFIILNPKTFDLLLHKYKGKSIE